MQCGGNFPLSPLILSSETTTSLQDRLKFSMLNCLTWPGMLSDVCYVTENVELRTPYINPECEYTSRLPELCRCCYCQPLHLQWKLTGNKKIVSISKIMKYSEHNSWILHCFLSRSQGGCCVIITHYNNSVGKDDKVKSFLHLLLSF